MTTSPREECLWIGRCLPLFMLIMITWPDFLRPVGDACFAIFHVSLLSAVIHRVSGMCLAT